LSAGSVPSAEYDHCAYGAGPLSSRAELLADDPSDAESEVFSASPWGIDEVVVDGGFHTVVAVDFAAVVVVVDWVVVVVGWVVDDVDVDDVVSEGNVVSSAPAGRDVADTVPSEEAASITAAVLTSAAR
jgi:hypothetical protein